MQTPQDFRQIEAAGAPTRFARGWHCLGLSSSFGDGKPHDINAFGTTLVVFASQSDGKLHILDGFCRHMGGNLTKGTIKGDSIACPFHDWRWGGDGKCTGIPYARRVPRVARTRSWPTMERNGQLFVWNDPQASRPPADVTIPDIVGYGSPEWTDWTWNSMLVEGSNCREIVDNVVDMAHFFYVHYSFPRYFKNVFEGHVATQYMRSTPRKDMVVGTSYGDPDSTLRSDASYYGPSYMIDQLWVEAHGVLVEKKNRVILSHLSHYSKGYSQMEKIIALRFSCKPRDPDSLQRSSSDSYCAQG